MAIEYLTREHFTLTSDVWSFGVVVWELLSFARIPYGHNDYDEVVRQLEAGHRLGCPTDIKSVSTWSPTKFYEEMTKLCFEEDPNERATFTTVVATIETYLSTEERSFYEESDKKYQSEHCTHYLKFGKS